MGFGRGITAISRRLSGSSYGLAGVQARYTNAYWCFTSPKDSGNRSPCRADQLVLALPLFHSQSMPAHGHDHQEDHHYLGPFGEGWD